MKTERHKRYEIRYIEYDDRGHYRFLPSSIVVLATCATTAFFWFKYGNPDVRILTCMEIPA